MRGTLVPLEPLLFVWATPDKRIIWKANTGAVFSLLILSTKTWQPLHPPTQHIARRNIYKSILSIYTDKNLATITPLPISSPGNDSYKSILSIYTDKNLATITPPTHLIARK
jgi:hypothetical protein